MYNTACKLLIRVLNKNSFHLLKYNYMYRQWQMKRRARQKVQLAFYHYGTQMNKTQPNQKSEKTILDESHSKSVARTENENYRYRIQGWTSWEIIRIALKL